MYADHLYKVEPAVKYYLEDKSKKDLPAIRNDLFQIQVPYKNSQLD